MNEKMSSIKIENDNRKEIVKELDQATKRALTAVGMQAVTDIISKGDFPVDTGLLRNSITFAVSGESPAISSYSASKGGKSGEYNGTAPDDKVPAVYIGTNVEYAKYVQYGTSKMAPRDFMYAPLKANIGHYKEILNKYIKQE